MRIGVAIAVLALALPATAAARAIPRPGPLVVPHDMPDRVIERGELRTASSRPAARMYRSSDGQRVEVATTSSYEHDPRADQALVDFLASRLHGRELGRLRVLVGTPDEIAQLCGGGHVIACYATDEQRMYVPGESTHGVPVEYALTHEYGHHVASWRLNTPWTSLDWGAKHWASALHVCRHVETGALWPGDQGRHYLDDPGEGFADGYAHLHYPRAPWRFNDLMRPRARVNAALRRDVLHPWSGPRTRTFRGRLGARRTSQTFRFRVRLDGDVIVRFSGPRGARYELEAAAPRWAFGRRLRARDGFGVEWCRRQEVEDVTVTVRRRRGAGPFALTIRYPG